MKKILFIAISMFCSFCAIGQYAINQGDTSEVMQLSMPKGTNKIDEQQLKNRSHYKHYGESTLRLVRNHTYEKDGLLIYYGNCSNSNDIRKLSLERKQKWMTSNDEGIAGGIVFDSSKITTINNTRFLTIESHDKEDWTIQFISDYDKNGRYVHGTIEFKKADEAKAVQYLQTLLNSMHLRKK